MGFKWGNRSIQRTIGVNNTLMNCATLALKKSQHDMTIPWMGGLRTAEQQNRIFKTGASTLDGFTRKSYHQTGNALDVIPVHGGYSNDKAFRHFAQCMFNAWQEMEVKGYRLEWGGHWQDFLDQPHWQIIKL